MEPIPLPWEACATAKRPNNTAETACLGRPLGASGHSFASTVMLDRVKYPSTAFGEMAPASTNTRVTLTPSPCDPELSPADSGPMNRDRLRILPRREKLPEAQERMTTWRAASFMAFSIFGLGLGGFAIIADRFVASSRVSCQWDSASMTRSALSATAS